MGLQSMLERVRLLEGKFTILSKPQKGTTILIEIPMGESSGGFEKERLDH
jgi:signal transduction histidine kinase